MISTPRNSQLFEEHQIPSEGGNFLNAKLMLPKPSVPPRRLVFISPLVGASAAQALIVFRKLSRRGSVIMSYEYRGHSRSTGRFELDKTIVDTRYALDWAVDYARSNGLPLHGFATCFGVVPLLAQFANGGRGAPFSSISAISGLLRLDQLLRFDDFASVLSRHFGTRLDSTNLLERIRNLSLDVCGTPFRDALEEYLTGHFPDLRIGRDYFEELRYDRANTVQTLLQLAEARYLDAASLPQQIPCRFYLGRHDELFGLHTHEGRRAYRDQVLSLIPHAQLYEMDFDHFGRGADHDRTLDGLGDLFEESERRKSPSDLTRNIRGRREIQ